MRKLIVIPVTSRIALGSAGVMLTMDEGASWDPGPPQMVVAIAGRDSDPPVL